MKERVAAGSNHELTHAPGRIERSERVLRSEPLVVVGMTDEDQIGIAVVEGLPQICHIGFTRYQASTETRVVPVRERASRRVRGEIGAQPRFLGRSRATAADEDAVAVQRDDVPAAEVVAVPTLRGIPGNRAPVAEVAAWALIAVVMVPWGWTCSGLELAPARLVARGELSRGAVFVGEVAERGDRPGDLGNERRGRLVPGSSAVSDIAGRDQRRGNRPDDEPRPRARLAARQSRGPCERQVQGAVPLDQAAHVQRNPAAAEAA